MVRVDMVEELVPFSFVKYRYMTTDNRFHVYCCVSGISNKALFHEKLQCDNKSERMLVIMKVNMLRMKSLPRISESTSSVTGLRV